MQNVREASQHKVDEIIQYITEQIDKGVWNSGDKLPTEKALIQQFSAARNTVRKGLAILEDKKIIVRHVGRGTFVRDDQADTNTAELVAWSEASPSEINETRILLEPTIAELVVSRATQTDINYAKTCLDGTLSAKTLEKYEYWDAQLHATIIKASKNNMLTNIYQAIHHARQRVEWHELKRRSLNEERRKNYDKEHTQIVDSLTRRDAVALRQALKSHLQSVSGNMLNPIDDSSWSKPF
ncbi:MAG: FCD domain-containing protein [Gammaproteobacteria bacterium]|nr:FCD domain-containing protein [Gammaproteobacteria bacterium]